VHPRAFPPFREDFRVMKGVSHWPMLDRPDEFARDLDDLLAQVR
jgi:pimeloyl-ACP methyl ester carboxylesterase